MNILDTAAIFGMAAGRHGPSAIDDAMRIVDLHKCCSDLQTAYDDSVDHFADSFDAAMSSIQRCQIIDSVPTIENFPSWAALSALSACWSLLRLDANQYRELLSTPSVSQKIRPQLEVLNSAIRECHLPRALGKLDDWQPDITWTMDLMIAHLVGEVTAVGPHSDIAIYQKLQTLLTFDCPMLLSYVAGACLCSDKLWKHYSLEFSEEQSEVLRLMCQFPELNGVSW